MLATTIERTLYPRARRARRVVPWIPLVPLILGACAGGEDERIDLGRPPVVLIVLDALHAGHLSHLGNARDTTPNLDALAAKGVSFTDAIAPAPYTLATIPSILTGRLPDRHGLVDQEARLGAEEQTLAELMGRAGYRTCAAVGNLNGSSIFGCDQGFGEYVEVFLAEDGRSVDVVLGDARFHHAKAVDFPPLVERFLAADDGRPLFLYLHIVEPHDPYAPPDAFRARYVEPGYDGPYVDGDTAALTRGRQGDLPFTEADRTAVEALYDANLAHVDAVVGQILAQLDAAEVLDDALVVITSDHGEAFWQHGEQGHGTTLYDEMLQVPLIVRFPEGTGPAPGARPDDLVSPMDLVPSLCDWLDLPLPASDLDGKTLTDAILGRGDDARELVLRSDHQPAWFGIRSGERKTIAAAEPGQSGLARIEHYLLADDIGEKEDLVRERADAAREDALRLRAYAAETAQHRADRGLPISDAERAMLKRMGYAGD